MIMNNKHNMQSYMIPIVTILIVDNMGYYGILWDNSLAIFIKKEETRNEFLVAIKKHRNHEGSNLAWRICSPSSLPVTFVKNGNVHGEKRTPAIHPPGTYQTFRKKNIGISRYTPYWYLHDWFSRRCPSPVKFVCLIPRCRTRGFGGSPWTFLLTVSCWSPKVVESHMESTHEFCWGWVRIDIPDISIVGGQIGLS